MRQCFQWSSIKRLLFAVWLKLVQRQFAEVLTTFKDYIERCSWCDSECGVLDYSVEMSNHEAVEALIKSGYKFDVEDSMGMTPMMNAVINGNFKEARILHLARVVDLLNSDKSTIYMSFGFLEWRRLEIPMMRDLVRWLQEKGWNSRMIGQVIAEVSRTRIGDVVCFKDPGITEGFLRKLSGRETYGTTRAFEIITPTLDLRHVKIILQHSPIKENAARQFCYYIVKNLCHYQKTKAGRVFLKRVFSFEVFSEDTLEYLEKNLRKPKRFESIKIFLKYDFHVVVKQKYGRDLLACLFGNSNPKVVSLLKDEQIDINGLGYWGNTPLHFAASIHSIDNVKMLLDKGADPNIFNKLEETPLEVVMTEEDSYFFEQAGYQCVKLLLLAGANPFLICDIKMKHLENNNFYDSEDFPIFFVKAVELLVAQTVVYEKFGHSMEKFDYLRDVCNRELKVHYEKCSAQLKELIACEISDITNKRKTSHYPLTLFDVLVENPEKLSRRITEEDLQMIAAFVKNNDENWNSHHRDLLRKRVEDTIEIHRRRARASRVICEFTGINDPHHLVIEKIIKYLSTEDIRKLSSSRYEKSNWLNRYYFGRLMIAKLKQIFMNY